MKIKYKIYIRVCNDKSKCSECVLYDKHKLCNEALTRWGGKSGLDYIGCFILLEKYNED